MIHPGFFQCNVKTNLAREKDGEKHIMVERMYSSLHQGVDPFRDLLPPLITLRRKGSLEHPPSPLLQFSLDTFTSYRQTVSTYSLLV